MALGFKRTDCFIRVYSVAMIVLLECISLVTLMANQSEQYVDCSIRKFVKIVPQQLMCTCVAHDSVCA